MKYHLSNPEDFSVYKCSKTLKRILNKECYIRQNTRKITKLPRKRLEYLYHNVGYCSIITKLHSDAPVMIDAGVDYLVYESRLLMNQSGKVYRIVFPAVHIFGPHIERSPTTHAYA